MRRSLASFGALAVVVAAASLTPAPSAGQAAPAAATKRTSAKSPKTWTAPHTAWGDPDLQGLWDNGTITPLERPSAAGEKALLTEREAAAADAEAATRADAERRPKDAVADLALAYNQEWWDRGKSIGRTSLIVDPRDGRLPPLTPEGQRRVDARAAAAKTHGPADSWEDRPLQERCLLYHGVPPMPTGYNNNYHIVQTPDYVAILHEMIHEVRLIPLDGRAHVGSAIRQWLGDSRGHWEGTTLVVETTNYSDKATLRFPVAAETLRVVERLTRVASDKIDYRFTVDDPTIYTRPWTAVLPMKRIKGPIYEYACHEGNYGMANVLAGYRAQEKVAEEAARKRQK
jgi:hypothetical protein